MAENSLYFESIVANRALHLTEEEQLEGNTLISQETENSTELQVLSYIQENFSNFMTFIRYLKKEDQDMLLCYYLLGRTQNALSPIFSATQTVCSFRIRMAIKTMLAFIQFGVPTEEKMREVFIRCKVEKNNTKLPLSKIVILYLKHRDFGWIARLHRIHRPEVRRSLSRASKTLLEIPSDPEANALGAYIHSLIDKVNPDGIGLSKRELKKREKSEIHFKDPDCLGQFHIKLDEGNFKHMFSSRANR